jgi:hypothetical protein
MKMQGLTGAWIVLNAVGESSKILSGKGFY